MILNDSTIIKLPGFMFELAANMTVEGNINIENMVMHHDVYTLVQPVSYSANITNTGEAFTVVRKILTKANVNCARCLESVEVLFNCNFDAYVLNPENASAKAGDNLFKTPSESVLHADVGSDNNFAGSFDNGSDEADNFGCFDNFDGEIASSSDFEGSSDFGGFDSTDSSDCFDDFDDFDDSDDEFSASSFETEDEYDVLPHNHELDLRPYIESALRLNAPAMPLCSPDCKGLCSQCGTNLNTGSCNCAHGKDISQSPFAVLKDLKFD